MHKVCLFFGYIPKTLNIDENTLQGKLIAYRIWTGKTYLQLGKKIAMEKSTIIRFVQNQKCKSENVNNIRSIIFMKNNVLLNCTK